MNPETRNLVAAICLSMAVLIGYQILFVDPKKDLYQQEKITKENNDTSNIPLPENIEKKGEYFGLKVQGDSMIEAGINDGDTVVIKKTDTADNGKIVVALIDDHEAMLKRIRRKGKTIALESANRNYETKIFGPDRVKVQGVLVSLYRSF